MLDGSNSQESFDRMELSDVATHPDRDAQPAAGVNAALGSAFNTRGRSNSRGPGPPELPESDDEEQMAKATSAEADAVVIEFAK